MATAKEIGVQDRTFQLIKAHQQAERKYCAVIGREDRRRDANSERRIDQAEKESSRALRRLCNYQPKSPKGVAAVLRYLGETDAIDVRTWADGRTERVLNTLASAVERFATPHSATARR